mmetsp:Transcript_25650/g.35708  ORF Transcript_25650/g.35708 Transcript_25650/m.35708 type:complete len:197 (+) Transcript_25650:31-621(+)
MAPHRPVATTLLALLGALALAICVFWADISNKHRLESRIGISRGHGTGRVSKSYLRGSVPVFHPSKWAGYGISSSSIRPADRLSVRSESLLSPSLKNAIDNLIKENNIVLFMKGTRDFPQCGFSNTCVQILNRLGVPYETVNVLENEMIRQGMKVYSDWPTFPQVYIAGEFYGGCDIMLQGYETGDLAETIEKTFA